MSIDDKIEISAAIIGALAGAYLGAHITQESFSLSHMSPLLIPLESSVREGIMYATASVGASLFSSIAHRYTSLAAFYRSRAYCHSESPSYPEREVGETT